MASLRSIVNFLFETGIHAKTPRSGFIFLGTGEQSLAEHTNRTVYIGFTLAHLAGADVGKVVQMCLFHDFAEGRTGDFNYVYKIYNESDEERVMEDAIEHLPFAPAIREIYHEYHERKSLEALLAKDADILEILLFLKEQLDVGNQRAAEWIMLAKPRIKTELGKQLADELLQTDSADWFKAYNIAYNSSIWMKRKKEIPGSMKET